MADGEYHVVFQGQLTGDLPADAVKRNLATLFRLAESRVEAMFDGRRVVLKRHVDETTARKLEAALHRAGAACLIETDTAASAPDEADDRAGASPDAAAATGATATAGDPNRTIVPLAVPEDLGGIALDDSEAMQPADRDRTPPDIDTSGLTLEPAE